MVIVSQRICSCIVITDSSFLLPVATILLCQCPCPPSCYANTCGHHLAVPVSVSTILLCQYLLPPSCCASVRVHHLVMPIPVATILLCPGQRQYTSGCTKSCITEIILKCNYFPLHSDILFARIGDRVMLAFVSTSCCTSWCL
jgi:hypothetical protein